MLAANARRKRVGLGPTCAQMGTLLPSGKYVHHWVVVRTGAVTFSSNLAGQPDPNRRSLSYDRRMPDMRDDILAAIKRLETAVGSS